MRIGIDCRSLQEPEPSGVSAYTRETLRALVKLPQAAQHTFVCFVNGFGLRGRSGRTPLLDSIKGVATGPNVEWRVRHWPNKLLTSAEVACGRPGFEWMFGNVDVVFLPNLQFFPLRDTRVPFVLTVHDLSFERYPDCLDVKGRLRHRLLHPRASAHAARSIIAVSEYTKWDVQTLYGVPAEKIHVVYPGVAGAATAIERGCAPSSREPRAPFIVSRKAGCTTSSNATVSAETTVAALPAASQGKTFWPPHSAADRPLCSLRSGSCRCEGQYSFPMTVPALADAKADMTGPAYPVPEPAAPITEAPYIAFVSTVEPRKNVATLLQAMDVVRKKHPQLELVIIGRQGWKSAELVQRLKQLPYVHYLGYADEATKQQVVAGARAFVYPSLYEGFGFPPLEAQRLGVPVIAGAHSSLPEVVGDSALLADVLDVDSLARAINSVLTDDMLRQHLITAGLTNVQRFQWTQSAEQVLKILTGV